MAKKPIVKVLIAIVVIAILGFLAVKYIPRTSWYKNATTTKAGSINAEDLAIIYTNNSVKADSLYTNKLIEVKGKVASAATENEQLIVNLTTQDSTIFIAVSLKPNQQQATVGETIVIKGVCVGMLTDVQINEAEIIKK